MQIITVDLETYYSREFSLSKITTEEYVRSPMFEVIGVGVKVDNNPTEWASGSMEQLAAYLRGFDWENSALLAHNTMFDGAILSWKFGIRPKVYLDTLCMARALHGVEVSGSLKALVERYGLGAKGTEVVNAMGKRRRDFTEEELSRYGDYCVNDVELTYALFNKLTAAGFPKKELKLIDLTLRMFTEPVLELDRPHLEQHLMATQAMKDKLLVDAGITDKADLMSNPKFAQLLTQLGVEPPMKISPTTGKPTLALSKSDEEFKALADHEDARVQALVAARLGNKSTLEETRTQRFIDIAGRGKLPVPIRYYAAHTGRWGGDDKINLQNLPSRGPNAKQIKKAIIAPEGYTIIEADSAQIEARVLAWLAGQSDIVQAFAEKKDVYKKMASAIYGKPEDQIDKQERHVGKTTVLGCFAADTKVLTPRGWVPIVDVTVTDTVWDGEEWVTHRGVVPQGIKETIRFSGIAATPDHEILTGHGWRAWCEVTTSHSLFQSALSLANSKSATGSKKPVRDGTLLSAVLAGGQAWWTELTSKLDAQPGATPVLNVQAAASGGSSTALFFPMTYTESAYSTAYPHVSLGATPRLAPLIRTTGGAVSTYLRTGVKTAQRFLATYSRLMGGMTRRAISTVLTTTKATNRGTSASLPRRRTLETSAVSPTYRQRLMTYDIAFAGPRNRFTIATNAGAIIVHNCGYGMGAQKFQDALKSGFPAVELPLDETRRVISVYRDTNWKIVQLWRNAQNALVNMSRGDNAPIDVHGLLETVPDVPGIRLPSGLVIRYDDLRYDETERGVQFHYQTRQGRTRIYGGKCLAGDTEVLTDRGWLRLRDVTRAHRVWDGVKWVTHAGLIYQGKKVTTVVNGVRMTPDHNVLTEKGWRCASSSEGLHRAGFWLPDGAEVSGNKWTTLAVGLPVQLRDGSFSGGYRRGKVCPAWWAPVVRVQGWGREQVTRAIKASGLLGVAVHAGSVPSTYAPSMAQLRGTGYQGMPGVGAIIRGVLGGHGANVSGRSDVGPEKQQRRLHPRELQVGDIHGPSGEPTQLTSGGHSQGTQDDWRFQIDAAVSLEPEPVYDLLNAGPDARFVVKGSSGPFIVHNCVENFTQGVARCIIGEQMLRIAKRYRVVLTVHDSIVCLVRDAEVPEAQAFIEAEMRRPPEWAPGLPVDCESGVGKSYGDCA